MSSITVGELRVSADENGFRFAVAGSDGPIEISLDAREAVTIERFLAEQRNGELRTGFRVPVQALRPFLPETLQVSLLYRGTIYDAVPMDLSLTGMLVRVPEISVSARTTLVARIILEDNLARLDAQVVRVDGDLVALHFGASMRGGEFDPAIDLGPIFSRLEQIYLKNRGDA